MDKSKRYSKVKKVKRVKMTSKFSEFLRTFHNRRSMSMIVVEEVWNFVYYLTMKKNAYELGFDI